MRLQKYYNHYLRYYFISKFNISTSWDIPKLKKVDLLTKLPPKNKEIYFWYNCLITGQRPKLVFRRLRKSRTRIQHDLTFLKTNLWVKQRYDFFEKVLIQITPYREDVELVPLRLNSAKEVQFTFQDFTTYDETQEIYNDPQNFIINDVSFSFKINTSSYLPYYNDCLLRMFQLPIKIIVDKKPH